MDGEHLNLESAFCYVLIANNVFFFFWIAPVMH